MRLIAFAIIILAGALAMALGDAGSSTMGFLLMIGGVGITVYELRRMDYFNPRPDENDAPPPDPPAES